MRGLIIRFNIMKEFFEFAKTVKEQVDDYDFGGKVLINLNYTIPPYAIEGDDYVIKTYKDPLKSGTRVSLTELEQDYQLSRFCKKDHFYVILNGAGKFHLLRHFYKNRRGDLHASLFLSPGTEIELNYISFDEWKLIRDMK